MADTGFPYQPGAMLHDAIIGAFRANASSFDGWCRDTGIAPSVARNVTMGQMRGPRGKEILADMIAAAGADVVDFNYRMRLKKHLRDMGSEAEL